MREMEHVTGAAAPGADRLVSARERLDAAWVIVVAALLIASAFLPLIDLPTAALQTIDAPLRVYPFVLPASAIIAAVASVVTRSSTFGAVATGLLVPSIALIGSISVSIFLDESSAFADGGVALSLFAAGVGVVMTVRWFVYHPAPLLGDEPRPIVPVTWALVGAAVVASALVGANAVDSNGSWSVQFVAQLALALAVPAVLVGAATTRTHDAMVLAAAAAAAQVVAVVVSRNDTPEAAAAIAVDSSSALWVGVPGLVALAAGAVVGAVGAQRRELDELVAITDDDSADWRWDPTD